MRHLFISGAFVLTKPLLSKSRALQNGSTEKLKCGLRGWNCIATGPKCCFVGQRTSRRAQWCCNISHGQAFVRLRISGGSVRRGKQVRDCFSKRRGGVARSAVIFGKCDRRGLLYELASLFGNVKKKKLEPVYWPFNVWSFRKFHSDDVAKYKIYTMKSVRAETSSMKIKIQTLTLIFSSIEKHMMTKLTSLEFSEHNTSIKTNSLFHFSVPLNEYVLMMNAHLSNQNCCSCLCLR